MRPKHAFTLGLSMLGAVNMGRFGQIIKAGRVAIAPGRCYA